MKLRAIVRVSQMTDFVNRPEAAGLVVMARREAAPLLEVARKEAATLVANPKPALAA